MHTTKLSILSKNALAARSSKKRSFFLLFCKILWDIARILQESCCKIPANPTRSCRNARKKERPFLIISCKSIVTGESVDHYKERFHFHFVVCGLELEEQYKELFLAHIGHKVFVKAKTLATLTPLTVNCACYRSSHL